MKSIGSIIKDNYFMNNEALKKNYEENIYSSNMQDRIDDLYSIINEKEEEIQALEDTNTSLMEENEYLKKRLSDINDKLNEITSE